MPKHARRKKNYAAAANRPKPSQRPLPSMHYPQERVQRKDFYKRTKGCIHRRFEMVQLSTTIEELAAQRNTIFDTSGLLPVTESLKVTDANGEPLIFFLKNALSWPFEKDHTRPDVIEEGYGALKNLEKQYPPPRPGKKDKRHKLKQVEGQPETAHPKGSGVYHFTIWHAAGHQHAKDNMDTPTNGAKISKDVIKSGQALNATNDVLVELTSVTQAVGALFEVADPDSYRRYHSRFHDLADNTAVRLFRTTARNCFAGVAVIKDLCCKPHRDGNDKVDGWAADLAFGNFTGGSHQIPQTGREFELRPGDVLFMRSSLLQHSVSPITGERFGLVYFTHASVMKT